MSNTNSEVGEKKSPMTEEEAASRLDAQNLLWNASTVRGFNLAGEEVRVVGQYFVKLTCVGLVGIDETAYVEKPDLVERYSVGRKVGYKWVADYKIEPIIVGKTPTYRGMFFPAWVATLKGRIVTVLRHCTVIDVTGKPFALKS